MFLARIVSRRGSLPVTASICNRLVFLWSNRLVILRTGADGRILALFWGGLPRFLDMGVGVDGGADAIPELWSMSESESESESEEEDEDEEESPRSVSTASNSISDAICGERLSCSGKGSSISATRGQENHRKREEMARN